MILQGPFVSTQQQLTQTPPMITATAVAAASATQSPPPLPVLPSARHPPLVQSSAPSSHLHPRRAPALCSGEKSVLLQQVTVKHNKRQATANQLPPPQLNKCNNTNSNISISSSTSSVENSKKQHCSSLEATAALVVANSRARSAALQSVDLRSLTSLDRATSFKFDSQNCSSPLSAAAAAAVVVDFDSGGGIDSTFDGGAGIVDEQACLNNISVSSSPGENKGSDSGGSSCSITGAVAAGGDCSSGSTAASAGGTGSNSSNVNLTPPNGFSE